MTTTPISVTYTPIEVKLGLKPSYSCSLIVKGKYDLSQLITVLSSSTISISLKNSGLKVTSQALTLLGKKELLNTQINY